MKHNMKPDMKRKMTTREREAERVISVASTIARDAYQTQAWMRLFTKVDSILVGRRIPVTAMATGMPFPAMTDGITVKFNADWIADAVLRPYRSGTSQMARKAVAMLKGINYHELGHVLFSPNRTTSTYAVVLDRECQKAVRNGLMSHPQEVWLPANIMEDQRIESLFSALYPGAKSFFRASTLLGIINDSKTGKEVEPSTAFIFTHGRRFIPPSLRKAHREAAIADYGVSLVEEWSKIMDEYVTLSLTDDCIRAAELTIQGMIVLRQMGLALPDIDHGGDKPGAHDGKSDSAMDQNRAKQAAEKAKREVAEDKEQQEAADKAQPATDDSATPESGDGDGDDAGEEAGDDGDETDANGGGSPDDGDESDSGDEMPSSGSGGTPKEDDDEPNYGDPHQPTNAHEALEDLMNDGDFSRELDMLMAEFKVEADRGDVETPKKNKTGLSATPSPEDVGVVNRMYKVLQQMRSDSGDSWERKLEHGKVNLLDFATRKPWEIDFFDHHDEGREDEFDMEVVILLDMSPSMGNLCRNASLALWQIKAVMQRFGIPVTAYGYNDGIAKTLYAPGDAVSTTAFENFGTGGGGTDPEDGLRRAYNIFSRSSANRKILFTITDGEWNANNRFECDALVQKINGIRGVTSIIIGLSDRPGMLLQKNDRSTYHQHHMGKEVNDPKQILDVFKEYVYEVGRKALLH